MAYRKIIFDYIDNNIPITYHKQDNCGFGAARNKGLAIAKENGLHLY